MKKLFIVLAFAGLSMASFAQDADPVEKYSVATNSFWSNWFVQAGADWNAWYSDEEHGMDLSKSPLKKFRSNPGASIAFGKWFTPSLALRTKIQGIWGKSVTDDNNAGNSMKYWTVNEQVMFNLSNLFLGYNPARVWNMNVFGGAGISRNMSGNQYTANLSAGVQSTWRLSKITSIYVEGGYIVHGSHFDGYSKVNDRGWDGRDNQLYAEVGLSFNLGKSTWDKVPDVDAIKALSQSQIDALNSQLNDANAENARLKEMLKNQKPATTASEKVYVTAPVSVFFNIGKSKVASKKDLVNVQALAKYAKDNNANLLVTGYADSATGTPEYNQKLSQKRADIVADALVNNMGVNRAQVSTVAKGGVSDLSPVSYNRRATVEVAK